MVTLKTFKTFLHDATSSNDYAQKLMSLWKKRLVRHFKANRPGCSDTLVAIFSSNAPAERPAQLLKLAFPTAVFLVTWSTIAFVSTKPSVLSSHQWGFKAIVNFHSTMRYYLTHSSGITGRQRGRWEKHCWYSKLYRQLHVRLVMETLSVVAAMPLSAGPKKKKHKVSSIPAPTFRFAPVLSKSNLRHKKQHVHTNNQHSTVYTFFPPQHAWNAEYF